MDQLQMIVDALRQNGMVGQAAGQLEGINQRNQQAIDPMMQPPQDPAMQAPPQQDPAMQQMGNDPAAFQQWQLQQMRQQNGMQ